MMGRVKRKVSHLMHPVQGEIWCLHRVVPTRSIYPSNRDLEITPEYLEQKVVDYKRNGFSFVTLEQLLFHQSLLLPRKRVNVSFDDGFKDVYEIAFPILRKHHVPFTLYLTTGFPDGTADLWWIQLEKERSIDEYERIIKAVYESGKPMAEEMHRLTQTDPDRSICLDLALNWAEIKEMVDSGLCTIGSHTVSHPGLVRIDAKEIFSELHESKRVIEEKLGVEVDHLSYPHSMQDEGVQRMVAEAGYTSATLGYGGNVRKGDNMYCLNRRHIIQD